MTLLQKILGTTWWNNVLKTREILLELFSNSQSIEERVELLENSTGEVTLQDLSPIINIIDSGNYIIPNSKRTRIITLTDDTPQIVTLPAIENAIGAIYFISNASEDEISSVSILSNTGSSDIWDSGLATNNKEVIFGSTVRIINDGLTYKIL